QSFFISDLGKPKVDAIKQQIANINPFVQVVAKRCHANQHNIVDLCCGASVVCEAVDDPATKAMIVNKLIEDCPNVWLVASSGMAGIYSANLIKTTKKMNRLFVCGDGQNEAKKGEGLMSPRVVACAAHQANMALRLLMDIEEE
ncbi:MAG: ThiF family adenylyltransferase, partial [Clostridia bacterium]